LPLGESSMFWLPFAPENTSSHSDLSADSCLVGLNILCVDATDPNLKVLAKQPSAAGAVVFTASSAALADDILGSEKVHRLLVDYQMPTEDGVQFARRLRESERYRDLKIVLISSVCDRSQYPSDTNEVVDASLIKPVRGAQLIASLFEERVADLDIADLLADVEEAMGAGQSGFMQGINVLLAEDNAVNQKVALKMLSALGCNVDVVENGVEAAAAAQKGNYDIVFMDCQMPDLDGYGATRQIRSHEAGRKRVPVVAMTANVMQGDREKCIAAGMDDYVSKPVVRKELSAIVSKWRSS
ncbi:MAG: response regulator, partial [Planctomycetes bacterium]|nr:response regulator [Planctomycetota bacterium]